MTRQTLYQETLFTSSRTMSSRHLLNPALQDPSKLQIATNPAQQLSEALTSLTQSYPPQNIYSSHECHGLYSGPTSIAYLFLRLNRTHPQLRISNQGPLHWAQAYLAGKRSAASVTASRNGVINEELAFLAVHAALTQDLHDVKSLAKSITSGVLTAEQGSDEWLYGRAGCLYLLRLVRSWVQGSGDIIKPVIEDLVHVILSHGPSWPWHGKDYLGMSSQGTYDMHFSSLFRRRNRTKTNNASIKAPFTGASVSSRR